MNTKRALRRYKSENIISKMDEAITKGQYVSVFVHTGTDKFAITISDINTDDCCKIVYTATDLPDWIHLMCYIVFMDNEYGNFVYWSTRKDEEEENESL